MVDKNILNNKPQHNPLQTPKGYFDEFTDKLMRQLPEQESVRPKFSIMRFTRYAVAAVMAGVCIGTGTYFYTRQSVSLQDTIASPSSIALYTDDQDSDDYIDEALDYEMIDNEELAYYLTEAY